MKRIFKIVLILLVILVVLFTGLNYLGVALDEEALEYTQLKPIEEVASQNNGFDVLKKGLDQLEEIDSQLLDSLLEERWDNEQANELIKKYSAYFDLVDDVLEKSAFKTSPFSLLSDFPDYNRYLSFVKIGLIKSKYLARQENYKGSIETIGLILNFTEIIKKDRFATLIAYMAGYSFQYKTLSWVHKLVSNYALSEEELAQIAKLFEIIPDYQNDGFEQVLSGEFVFMQATPDDFVNPNLWERTKLFFGYSLPMRNHFSISIFDLLAVPSHHYFFQKNRTANRTYLRNISLQSQVKTTYCNQIDFSIPITSFHFMEGVGMNYIGNEGFGINPAGNYDLSMESHFGQRCFANFYTQAIKTVIALKQFSNENKIQATSLSQLIPDFLTTVPVDTFTGELILYNPKAHTIYARGSNSLDNGGEESNFVRLCRSDEHCKNDPTVGIKFE